VGSAGIPPQLAKYFPQRRWVWVHDVVVHCAAQTPPGQSASVVHAVVPTLAGSMPHKLAPGPDPVALCDPAGRILRLPRRPATHRPSVGQGRRHEYRQQPDVTGHKLRMAGFYAGVRRAFGRASFIALHPLVPTWMSGDAGTTGSRLRWMPALEAGVAF
jgi:hypothetical protein